MILSFPGLGIQLGARMLAEIGDDRKRFADARGLKAYAGSSPITRASGKKSSITRRWVKNDRLNHVRRDPAERLPRLRGGAEEFSGEHDHVHLRVEYSPKVTVSKLENSLRPWGRLRHRARRRSKGTCAESSRAVIRAIMHGQFWSPSYFTVSYGGAPLSAIRQYIENQWRPPVS